MTTGFGRFAVWCLIATGIALLGPSPQPGHAQDAAPKVQSVEIRGNTRIDETVIRGRLTLKAGDVASTEAIRTQIRLIYDMGFFEDVRVTTDQVAGGVAVAFVVREKPFITEIVFDGNDKLSEDKLKEKITVRGQSFLDQQQAKESAEKIRLAYADDGYYKAEVIPVIQTLQEDQKRLTFYIKEGEQAKVKTVVFDGAKNVSKKELLKVLATREWVPLISLMTDAGLLKREELSNDVERIREVYMNKGYMTVQIGQPTIELTGDKKWFIVTFPIVEGEPYTVGEVGIRGTTVFEEAELKSGMSIQAGEVYQRAKIRDEITRLTELYGSKGYAFTDVTPSVTSDPQTRTAKILFHIKEGDLIRVRQIHITGNDRTRDNVIRREMRVNEQEIIDTVAMKRSFQRLNNLNFFETVEILPKQVEPDKVDLDVKVKEKPTGAFSVGGGFSTLDQLVAVADITEGNLWGTGQMLRIRGQLGQRRTLGLVTFRNPYLYDSPVWMQIDGYSTRTNYLTYSEDRQGVSASFGRWLSEYISGSLTPFAEGININILQSNAPEFLVQQQGYQSSTGIRSMLSRDTRDYYLDPRTGTRMSIGVDYATPALGGTNHFYKIYPDVIRYWPLLFDTRFSARARYGIVQGVGGKPIPVPERFFVGGINTVRGFQFGRAGPVTSSGTLEGAAQQLIFNFDFIFTVSSEAKLNGVLFFDYGKGFDNDAPLSLNLRPATGIEVRWISPFGPLRAAYGINLDPKPNEKVGVFEFSVGTLF